MARYKVGLETRQRILDATRELLAEVGLEGATIAAICARAGVRPGSFYNLFDSKEQAVLSVAAEAIQAVDPDPAETGRDTLGQLIDAYVRFITEQPELARVYVQLSISGGLDAGELGRRSKAHHERRVERFTAALERSGAEADDARAEAEVILATMNGLAFGWLLDSDLDFAGHVQRAFGHHLSSA